MLGFAVGVLSLLIGSSAYSQQSTVLVQNNDGEAIFQLDFYGNSQGSSRDWTQAEIDSITEAAQYWVDVLKAHGTMPNQLDADGNVVLDDDGNPVTQPVVFEIYFTDAEDYAGNASAAPNGYQQSTKDGFNLSLAEALMVDGVYADTVGGGHATITVGTGWNARSGNQSQTGRVQQDLTPVIIHELGHALGVASSAGYDIDYVNMELIVRFPETISRYDSRLRDNNGNSPLTKPGATEGKIIGYDETGTNADTIFDIGDPDAPFDLKTPGNQNPSQVTFVGKNTLELWYGKEYDKLTEKQQNKGVPIQGYVYYPYLFDEDDNAVAWTWLYNPGGTLSHINTTNSLMSWQAYRNYQGFIEIEMAVMQDLGYTVERSNFFGKSFYVDGDGETPYYNAVSFAYWNADTQSYDLTKPNDATYAIGAHLFAKNLNIFQTGNIWTAGAGSAGVRIDGSNNKFTLTSKTSVTADGVNGIGLLASYGKDHNITLQQGSSVQATGPGGIAVSFDFGEPGVGDKRGSYYYGYIEDEVGIPHDIGYLPELFGPLVQNFNVSGTITGSRSGHSATYRTSFDEYLDNVTDMLEELGYTEEEIEEWLNSTDVRVPGDVTDLRNYSWLEPWANDAVSRPFKFGAAIYIDETAAVDRINIMSGAKINGDIISNWTGNAYTGDPKYYLINEQTTKITFGYKADDNGAVTDAIDKDFKFSYNGNINCFRYELLPNILVHQGNGDYVSISPRYDGSDTLWEFITWSDGYFAYDSLNIVRPGDGYVYADVVTTGANTTELHFLGGTTEFLGTTAYVKNISIANGATLTLTPAVQEVYSTLTIDGTTYNVTRLSDILKTPEIHIYADFDWFGYDASLQTPTTTNAGRLTGEGAFYMGQRNYLTDYWAWAGTFRNDGVIAPGPDNGDGIGIMIIQGDLEFTKNGVYEVTIGGEAEERLHSGVLSNGMFVDHHGETYNPLYEVFIGENTTPLKGTGNDLIVVSNNTKMDGTLKVSVLPDSMFGNETTTHTIIESGTFTAGSTFKNIEFDQGFFAISDVFINPFNEHEAQIKVIRDLTYFENHGKTPNEIAVAKAVDNSLFHDAEIAFSLGDKRNSAADIRDVLHQMGSAHRANSVMMNLWNPSELLFNRIGWGNGQMDTGNRGRVDWDRIARKKARILGQGPVRQRVGSVWGDYFNTTFNADGDGNSDKYNIHRNGFMVGGEWNLTPYSAIGAIAAYANSKLKEIGNTVKSDDYMLGLYFVCAPYNEFEFKAYIGTGFQEYDFDRNIRNANIITDSITEARGIYDRYKADTQGNTLNISLELARPLMLHPTFILRPTLGIDSQFLWQDGFAEKNHNTYYNGNAYGSYLYAYNYKRMSFNRSLLRAGFSSETTGVRGGIRMRAFYVTRIDGDSCPTSEMRFVSGGDSFGIQGVSVGNNYLHLGVGANFWLDGEQSCSFFLDYDANIYNTSRKMDAHTFSLGLLQKF